MTTFLEFWADLGYFFLSLFAHLMNTCVSWSLVANTYATRVGG